MGLFCCRRGRVCALAVAAPKFVIIGLRPLGQFLCAIVEGQLQEALVMPVMTADMTRWRHHAFVRRSRLHGADQCVEVDAVAALTP